MVQEIIVYLIITFAFGAVTLNVLRFFNLAGTKKAGEAGKCGGCTSGCEVKELHQFAKAKSKRDPYQFYS